MYRKITRLLKYFSKATTRYKVHSPFVYDFCESILDDKRYYYAFDALEELRENMKRSKLVIDTFDYGAGASTRKSSSKKSIAHIAKKSLSRERQCQMMFKIVNHYKPRHILEFGTSLGLSALYMSFPSHATNIVSLEGCPNTAHIARQHIDMMKRKNVEIVVGKFGDTLPSVLASRYSLDLVFFDGNHRKTPTMEYFEACLAKASASSIFIFDDIHWSSDMEAAWEAIKNHPRVRLSIDLYEMGLVFFNDDIKEKQNFTLVESKYKPWLFSL